MLGTSTNRIGDYELLEVIGDGAEGRVYKARCVRPGASDELVALKRLRSTGQDKEALLFKRQTEILSKLDHPNIVRYKDSFVWREDDLGEEVFCLVTELLEGQSVKALLECHPDGLPWTQSKAIIFQALCALQYASKLRVVHRDLKLSNFYITRQGALKIIDFGIARDVDSSATTTAASGNIKGSFDYMAPDFVRQGAHFHGDEQSDIFSFGVCFYQILTGTLPFPPLKGNPLIGYVSRWHSPTPPEPNFRHPIFTVLSQAANCIRKCLAADRGLRYRTFDEVMTDFQKIKPRSLRHGSEVYEYLEYLGKGGFGRVFRARRLRDGFETAIKEMLADRHTNRFVREAKILQKARHPNLVQYLDFVEVEEQRLGDQRRLFLVMEYLKGMPGAGLRERIRNTESGLEARETLTMFARYLDCLEHLHKLGIIHRDIKPGNLYAPEGDPGNAKIFDLGIAHDIEGTRTQGQIPGTLDYMPPEFATHSSNRGSPQSDIYSLGVTLYQALTKKLPFPRLPEREPDAWIAFFQRSQNPPDCPFDHPVFKAHPELVPLIRRAIAPIPQQRYPSASAMQAEVLRILAQWEKQAALEAAMSAAREAAGRGDFEEAERQARCAVELIPENIAALALLGQASEKARRSRFTSALEAGRRAFERGDYVEAARWVCEALRLEPGNLQATELLRQIQSTMAKAGPEAEGESGTAPLPEDKHPTKDATAVTLPPDHEFIQPKIRAAPSQRPAQPKVQVPGEVEGPSQSRPRIATRGKKVALGLLFLSLAAAGYIGSLYYQKTRAVKRQAAFQTALQAARTELADGNFEIAVSRASEALRFKPGDAEASRLRDEAVAKAERLRIARQREQQYQEAIRSGQSLFDRQEYTGALAKADEALKLKADDPVAIRFRQKVQAKLDELKTAQQREQQYRAAVQAGRILLDRQDFTEAIRHADEALSLKPSGAEALALKHNAQAKIEELKMAHQREQQYQATVRAAQALFDNQDYTGALAKADEALHLKAGGTEAARLRQKSLAILQELKAAQEREQKYQVTVRSGQDLFNREDYAAALAKADEALRFKTDGTEATQLRQQAQAKLDELKAAQQREQQYQLALNAAQNALTRKDFATARTQAETALKLKPDDPAATQVRNQAIELPELAVAQSYFDQGDYGRAEEVAARFRESDFFKPLATAIQTERNALAEAKSRFDLGDYAVIQDVKKLAFGSKPPFVKLATEAQAEWELLHSFEGIKQTNGWAVLQTLFAAPAAAPVRSKPPFKALAEWAENEARSFAEQQRRRATQLDAALVQLLDSFNVSVPAGLRPAGARKAKTLGAIGEAGKPYYHAEVNKLENAYKAYGLLEQNNRAAAIRQLRAAIDNWE